MERVVRVAANVVSSHATYEAQRAAWRAAEEFGADAVFNFDHFFPVSGDPDGMNFECWTQLASMAEVTSRVEIGSLVTCNAYRNPNLLADMARTVDHISDGRLILSIGAGWNEREFKEYGYEYGTAGSRARDLATSMDVIKARLARLNPAPIRKIPILIGGGGEKVTLRVVAEHADIWNGVGGIDVLEHKLGVLREWCQRVGRDPAEIELSCLAQVQSMEKIEPLDDLLALGFTFVSVALSGPKDYDYGMLKEILAWRDSVNRSIATR